MSYVVLARKYRPQRFSDLIGQEHVSRTLQNQIKAKRQAQAYLFTGPRGVGKTSAARILAKALRCLNPTPDFEPCNECAACQGVNDGSSLDVLEIDAASNTGVENIRDLRENVGYLATMGRFRVYIVDEVHMLSTAAFNALLKTVEEPPPHVIFIFATTELHKVPATIQSRCQRFDFRRIPPDVMTASLQKICDAEGILIDGGALATIVTESEGCLRDSQSLLDQAIAFCGKQITREQLELALGLLDRAAFFDLVRSLGERNPGAALSKANAILSKGTDPKVFLTRLIDFLCDLHYFTFTGMIRIPDPDQDALLHSLKGQLSQDEVVRAMELALRTQASLHQNINASITAEALVVKLCLQRPIIYQTEIEKKSPVATPAPMPTPPSFSAERVRALKAPLGVVAPPKAPLSVIPSPAPLDSDTPPRRTLENFIRATKPAWTPVLQGILSIEIREGTAFVKTRADFAGKRLSSADGIAVLRTALQVEKAVVELESAAQGASNVQPRDSSQIKRKLAKEHEGVQAAMKIFGATITETKVLDDEKNSPSKGLPRPSGSGGNNTEE